MILKGYKYRIYPNKKQEEQIQKFLDVKDLSIINVYHIEERNTKKKKCHCTNLI